MKKIIFNAVALILLLSVALVGCSDDGNKEQSGTVSEVKVSGFEDFTTSFNLLRLFDQFGAVSPNYDERYISEGKVSAKMEILGIPNTTVRPYMVFPAYSKTGDFDFTDITKYSKLTADFYNAEEQDVTLYMGFAVRPVVIQQYFEYQVLSYAESYTLKPGWNSVSYVIEHDFLNILYNCKEVHGIYLMFENSDSYELSGAKTVYVDNIEFQLAKEEYTPSNPIELSRNEQSGVYEIASFDKPYQAYSVYMGWQQYYYREIQPDLSVVNAGFGANVGNSLRLHMRPGNSRDYGWAWLYLSGKLFQAADIGQLEDTAEYNYYIKFDLYNNSQTRANFTVEYYESTDTYKSAVWSSAVAEPGKWTTYRQRLSTLNITKGKDAFGNYIVVRFMDEPGRMELVWGGYYATTMERKDVLIDNVRIERERI